MSKKRTFKMKYSMMVNGEEYPREYSVTGVKDSAEAVTKLSKLCKCEIVITSIEEEL